MKKATLETIRTTLLDLGMNPADALIAELDAELNKGLAEKNARAAAYDAIHDIVIGALGETPATCGEIFEAIENELPEGVTKGKVQYALTHLWQDEIVKIEGKPNSYRKA